MLADPIRRYVQQWKDWFEIKAVKLVNETDVYVSQTKPTRYF